MLGIVNDTIVFTPFDKALENKVHTLNDEVRIARILSI